jgi:hypothetical protein
MVPLNITPNLEGPGKIQEFLNRYPVDQREGVFQLLYHGKEVRWKGTVKDVHIFPAVYYETDRGDSQHVCTENPTYYCDSQGNVVFDQYIVFSENVYCLSLRHADDYYFTADITMQGNEYIEHLNPGDTLVIQGILSGPDRIGTAVNLAEIIQK